MSNKGKRVPKMALDRETAPALEVAEQAREGNEEIAKGTEVVRAGVEKIIKTEDPLFSRDELHEMREEAYNLSLDAEIHPDSLSRNEVSEEIQSERFRLSQLAKEYMGRSSYVRKMSWNAEIDESFFIEAMSDRISSGRFFEDFYYQARRFSTHNILSESPYLFFINRALREEDDELLAQILDCIRNDPDYAEAITALREHTEAKAQEPKANQAKFRKDMEAAFARCPLLLKQYARAVGEELAAGAFGFAPETIERAKTALRNGETLNEDDVEGIQSTVETLETAVECARKIQAYRKQISVFNDVVGPKSPLRVLVDDEIALVKSTVQSPRMSRDEKIYFLERKAKILERRQAEYVASTEKIAEVERSIGAGGEAMESELKNLRDAVAEVELRLQQQETRLRTVETELKTTSGDTAYGISMREDAKAAISVNARDRRERMRSLSAEISALREKQEKLQAIERGMSSLREMRDRLKRQLASHPTQVLLKTREEAKLKNQQLQQEAGDFQTFADLRNSYLAAYEEAEKSVLAYDGQYADLTPQVLERLRREHQEIMRTMRDESVSVSRKITLLREAIERCQVKDTQGHNIDQHLNRATA